jgi:hypothetical protein
VTFVKLRLSFVAMLDTTNLLRARLGVAFATGLKKTKPKTQKLC